jgi:hypothetical protein
MPPLDTLTLVGKSGRKYELRVYPLIHRFKRLSGVYAVMERVVEPRSTPKYSTVYVGETENLATVLSGHEKTECFEMYFANTIGVFAEADAAKRAAIANDLSGALGPPCNRAGSP